MPPCRAPTTSHAHVTAATIFALASKHSWRSASRNGRANDETALRVFDHMLGIEPLLSGRGARRKDQRFYHHRHRARIGQHGADVDVIELLELEAVHGDDRI